MGIVVEDFEIVRAPGGLRLARLAGNGQGPSGAVTFALRENGHERRLEPLPGPAAAADGAWRVAYALPAGLDPDAASFSLVHADDAVVIELPAPRSRDVGRRRSAQLEERMRSHREAEDRLAARVVELEAGGDAAARRATELESAVGQERERAAGIAEGARRLEGALAAEREQVAALVREREAARTRVAGLERAIADERAAGAARAVELERALAEERDR